MVDSYEHLMGTVMDVEDHPSNSLPYSQELSKRQEDMTATNHTMNSKNKAALEINSDTATTAVLKQKFKNLK